MGAGQHRLPGAVEHEPAGGGGAGDGATTEADRGDAPTRDQIRYHGAGECLVPEPHQHRGRQGRRQEGPRCAHAAQLLEHHGQLGETEALAPVRFGHVQPDPASLHEVTPEWRQRLVLGLEQRPRHLRWAMCGSPAAHGVPEGEMVLGDADARGPIHRSIIAENLTWVSETLGRGA